MSDITFTEDQVKSTLMATLQIHEASWVEPADGCINGKYSIDRLTAAQQACVKNGLPESMARFIDLSLHWVNDVQEWCEGTTFTDETVLDEEGEPLTWEDGGSPED